MSLADAVWSVDNIPDVFIPDVKEAPKCDRCARLGLPCATGWAPFSRPPVGVGGGNKCWFCTRIKRRCTWQGHDRTSPFSSPPCCPLIMPYRLALRSMARARPRAATLVQPERRPRHPQLPCLRPRPLAYPREHRVLRCAVPHLRPFRAVRRWLELVSSPASVVEGRGQRRIGFGGGAPSPASTGATRGRGYAELSHRTGRDIGGGGGVRSRRSGRR